MNTLPVLNVLKRKKACSDTLTVADLTYICALYFEIRIDVGVELVLNVKGQTDGM